MHTPEHNPTGFDNASISDMSALQETVRFLVMHGSSDDNVHLQNTLVLVDKLDLASVENYDLHVYPDSDHNIAFHNAHTMVYERKSTSFLASAYLREEIIIRQLGLSSWLINAFNDEWHRIDHPVPDESMWSRVKRSLPILAH